MRPLRQLEGACPKCNRFKTRVGCKCTDGAPGDFPRRDPVTGLWYRPTTGEVLARPDVPPAPSEEQLELLDLGAGDAVREGLTIVRQALQRPAGAGSTSPRRGSRSRTR